MFKNVIAPVQAWLLSRGQCVGCGTPLVQGRASLLKGNSEKVICKCGRIYIHAVKNHKYRRALFEEV
jgi:RNase P subunit RPR2